MRMHKSLTLRTNSLLAGLWAALLVLMSLLNWPQPMLPIAIGAISGFLAGWLQGRGVLEHAVQLQSAQSSTEVRAIMVSSLPGKLSIRLLWITGLGALLWAATTDAGNLFGLWIPVYAAFALVREVTALPAIAKLNKMA
jgi:hypothetical protein